jgi:hypothetical protein
MEKSLVSASTMLSVTANGCVTFGAQGLVILANLEH